MLVLAGGMTILSPVWAATETVSGKVLRVLTIADGSFGGCMVLLDQSVPGAGLDCPGNWVTFSCTGDYTTVNQAKSMFEAAQVAFALDRRVNVRVDDTRRHNGWCYADRFEIR